MIKWRTAFVIAVRGTPRTGLPPRSFGRRRLVDKMGLDATKPKKREPFRYTIVHIPGEDHSVMGYIFPKK
jgi:hypothetical protein